MKNKEKFKEEIFEICCGGNKVAVNATTNTPVPCIAGQCSQCSFKHSHYCSDAFVEWCDKEYVQPCPFKENELVEVSDDHHDWRLRHFARMADNDAYPYVVYDRGNTSEEDIDTMVYKYCRKYGTLGDLV